MVTAFSLRQFMARHSVAIDRVAIGISGLCLVHCVTSAVLFGLLASAGGLFSPVVHEVGLVIAIVLGAIGLGNGIFAHQYMAPAAVGAFGLGVMAGALNMPHGSYETICTLAGVALVALAHDLNRRAAH